jgi:hypothetical protein
VAPDVAGSVTGLASRDGDTTVPSSGDCAVAGPLASVLALAPLDG